MNDLAHAIIRAIAEERRPGCRLFVLVAEQSNLEFEVQHGDLVVYAPATPHVGEAVVWSAATGPARFGRIARSGQVRAGGRWQQPVRLRGVIVAGIRSIPLIRPAPPEPGGFG